MVTVTAGPPPPSAAAASPPTMLDPHPAGDSRLGWTVPVVAGAAGFALLLRTVYAEAWAGAEPNYALFWAGMACLLIPVVGALSGPRTAGQIRALVAVYALLSFLPKVLRAPNRSWLFDEYAHLAQTDGVLRTGQLYASNSAVPMLQPFPGLHLDVAALVRATGVDTYHAGLVVVVAAHLAIVAAVFSIAHRLSGRTRLAGLAAVAYMTAPGWMLFGSQVSYESLALAFYAWALAGLVAALTATTSAQRTPWIVVTVAAVLGAVCTHHLSTAFTVAGIAVVLLAVRVSTRGLSRGVVGVLAVVATAGIVAGQFVNIPLLSYLGSVPAEGIKQLAGFLTGNASMHGVFTGSTLPAAERWTAVVIPALIVAGLWAGHRSGRLCPDGASALHRGAAAGITAVACGYVVAAPLVFTQVGAEAAHRSWAFTLLAGAVLAGAALDAVLDRLPTGAEGAGGGGARLLVTASLAVALVGNTAAGGPAETRFPGESKVGSDARLIGSDELWSVATWLRDTQGPDHLVLADAVSAGTIAGVGQQQLDLRFPTWDLTFFPGITPVAMKHLITSRADYLVVDKRMAEQLPRAGYYYKSYESKAFARTEPVPAEALTKLDGAAWLHAVYASEHYRVYAIDRSALELKVAALAGHAVDTAFLAP